MKFETRFNKGDSAWFMKDNKPKEIIISAIEIFYVDTNQSRIKYNGREVKNSTSWLDETDLFEASLFRTKKELLVSVFDGKTCKGFRCNAINGLDHSWFCIKEQDECYSDIVEEIPVFEGTKESLSSLTILT